MDPYYSAGLKLIERGFKGKVSSCSVMQKKVSLYLCFPYFLKTPFFSYSSLYHHKITGLT